MASIIPIVETVSTIALIIGMIGLLAGGIISLVLLFKYNGPGTSNILLWAFLLFVLIGPLSVVFGDLSSEKIGEVFTSAYVMAFGGIAVFSFITSLILLLTTGLKPWVNIVGIAAALLFALLTAAWASLIGGMTLLAMGSSIELWLKILVGIANTVYGIACIVGGPVAIRFSANAIREKSGAGRSVT